MNLLMLMLHANFASFVKLFTDFKYEVYLFIKQQ